MVGAYLRLGTSSNQYGYFFHIFDSNFIIYGIIGSDSKFSRLKYILALCCHPIINNKRSQLDLE